jgi:hypothetical protein
VAFEVVILPMLALRQQGPRLQPRNKGAGCASVWNTPPSNAPIRSRQNRGGQFRPCSGTSKRLYTGTGLFDA